jgi:hypothetical protein
VSSGAAVAVGAVVVCGDCSGGGAVAVVVVVGVVVVEMVEAGVAAVVQSWEQ